MTRGRSRHKHSAGRAATAMFLGPVIGFFGAWLSAEALLAARPHPLHWGAAFVGAAGGWVAVRAFDWFRKTAV